ncbi:MAG TPA: hypothetical protein VFF06_16475 [Polyangia bacterium]|nr:hypothetical protein [Polyangia bacterium]
MTIRRSLLSQMTGEPLAKSCDVPWSAMAGGERFRRCAECEREVWNLSAMTAREAEVRLLNASEWPCINYRVDRDGNLVSREEPRAPSRRLGLGTAAFVATTLVAPVCGSLAHAGEPPPKESGKTPQDKTPQDKTPQDKTAAKPPSEAARAFNPEDCPQPAPSAPGTTALNPPRPQPLGGAPPSPRQPAPSGTVELKTAKPRDVSIDGVTFHAPGTIKLPPGHHEAQFTNKKLVKRAFDVKLDATLVLDLDR